MEQPIIGYNVVELFVKENDDLLDSSTVVQSVSSSFSNVQKNDAKQLINLIQTNSSDVFCEVKSTKRDVVTPQGTTTRVPCRANTGCVTTAMPVLFEPDKRSKWPPGLAVQETPTTVKRGKSTILNIHVSNNTKHDVVLPKRTVIGRLQLVRSVTGVDVKLQESGDKATE